MSFEVKPGMTVHQAVKEAIEYCKTRSVANTDFIFNDIRVVVHVDSLVLNICEIYMLKCEIRRLKAGYKD